MGTGSGAWRGVLQAYSGNPAAKADRKDPYHSTEDTAGNPSRETGDPDGCGDSGRGRSGIRREYL